MQLVHPYEGSFTLSKVFLKNASKNAWKTQRLTLATLADATQVGLNHRKHRETREY